MSNATKPARRTHRFTFAAMVAVIALLSTSCYTLAAVVHEANAPDTRPWWCHSTGTGGHHVDPAYAGMTKGMLSWDECKALSVQFDLAIDYASQWPTLGDAEGDGMHRLVSYVEGMGTHHAPLGSFTPGPDFDPLDPDFPGSEIDEDFNAARPEFLMYDGNGNDAELVGFAWYVKSDSTTPPEGFAGDNDWWHRHEVLCFTNSTFLVVGEDITDSQCANRGGTNVHLGNYWMAHAWIVDGWNTKADVFTNHHPCLLPGGPADHDDPCWDVANGGGGHGGH